MKGPFNLFVLLFEQSQGSILILDQLRLTGQRDSVFITLLFPPSVVISFTSKQVQTAFNWGDLQQ